MLASTEDSNARLRSGATNLTGVLAPGLAERGWEHASCPRCGRSTFIKRRGARLTCCEAYAEAPRPPRPRSSRPPRLIWRDVEQLLRARKHPFDLVSPIVNPHRDTVFVVAGVQIFHPTVFGDVEPPSGLRVVPQPCVRLRYLDEVPHPRGLSTSFVNLCSEEFAVSTTAYFAHMDLWIDVFSAVGLHANYMVLSVNPDAWDVQPYMGATLTFTWCGIELGEGIWIHTIKNERLAGRGIMDFGFGLDRLVWAVNRTDTYYENIGPASRFEPALVRTLDRLRTIALLVGSGLRPGNRDAPLQLRRLLARYFSEAPHFDFRHAFRAFHDFWSDFYPLSSSQADCVGIVNEELDRNLRIRLCREADLPAATAANGHDAESLFWQLRMRPRALLHGGGK